MKTYDEYKALALEELKNQRQEELETLTQRLIVGDKVEELENLYKQCTHQLKYKRSDNHRSSEYCVKCGWDEDVDLTDAVFFRKEPLVDHKLAQAQDSIDIDT